MLELRHWRKGKCIFSECLKPAFWLRYANYTVFFANLFNNLEVFVLQQFLLLLLLPRDPCNWVAFQKMISVISTTSVNILMFGVHYHSLSKLHIQTCIRMQWGLPPTHLTFAFQIWCYATWNGLSIIVYIIYAYILYAMSVYILKIFTVHSFSQ